MKAKNIIRVAVVTLGLLLIPLVFTLLGSGVDGDGVHWTAMDFVVAGILLFVTGMALDTVIRLAGSNGRKVAYAGAIVLIFLYIWAELAVGIFTNLGS